MNYNDIVSKYKQYLRTPKLYFDGKSRCPIKESTFKQMVKLHDTQTKKANDILSKYVKEGRNIYCWSDQHFNHNNIIHYCGRPFKDSFEMNYVLRSNYLSIIKPDDIVIFGGDLAMGDVSKVISFIIDFPGIKFWVYGNHDFDKTIHTDALKRFFDYSALCFLVEVDNKELVISHYPIDDSLLNDNQINLHGHIHNRVLDSKKHINFSVENIDYKPKLINELLVSSEV